MGFEKSYDDDTEKNIAYDLRQIYAKLVGEHLIDITNNRKQQKFYSWLKSLEDLHTICKFKFCDKKKDAEDYKKLMNKIISLSNKYPNEWLNKSFENNKVLEIDLALRELEEYLYNEMEEAGVWGRGYVYDEDEI